MGRIENYEPTSAPYVDGADREPYIGRACVIRGVQDDPKARYGPRWVVEVAMLDSGEAVAFGLAKNAWRDRVMGAIMSALDDGEDIDPVVLFRDSAHPGKNGQMPWSFRSATDAEVEAAGVLAAGDDDNAPEPEPAPAKGRGR